MRTLITSLRLTVTTLLVCVGGYTALILGIGQTLTPRTADGSLVHRPDGSVAGSSLLAQAFTQPRYFWPRPSAVGCDAAAAGGSNKSPTSSDLTDRAKQIVTAHGATADRPLPAELAAASGSGLDPHLSEAAALYQVARVAAARGVPTEHVAALVAAKAFAPGGPLTKGRIVNVLELNLALDAAR